MEKKYKCEMCDSESMGAAGTCCGQERKAVDSDSKIGEGVEHNHKEGEVCQVCNVK